MPEAGVPVDPASFAVLCALFLGGTLTLASLRPRAVVAHPRTILLALGLVTLCGFAALVRPFPLGLNLRVDPSTEPLLPTGDAGVGIYRGAVRDFGDDQVYVVAMECGGVFRPDNLAALRRVGDAISRIDGVRSVTSLARVTSFRYVPEKEWLEVRPFIEEIPSDPAALDTLRERALKNPLYRRNIVSDDGRTAALNVRFKPMTDLDFIAAGIDVRIRSLLDAETREDRRFHVSGRPHVKALMYHTMTRDLAVLVPLGLVVVALVLAAVSGTPRGVVLPLLSLLAAVVWTFGAIAFLERPLTVLTILLAPTLVAIGSVYGVHVVSRYDEEAERGGSREEVVLRTCLSMRVPVLVAGVTTAVGFAALLTTDVPAVFEIGAFSILGVLSVTLLSLTAVPAALALLPLRERRAVPGRTAGLRRALDRGLAAAAGLACARPGAVIGVFAAITIGALAAIPRIVIDTDYLSFFDADAPVRVEFDRINHLLAGAVPLFIVLDGGEPGAFREPELLHRVEALEERLERIPGVSRTLSFLDGMRRLHRAVEADDPAAERIPETRAGVTELLFMFPKDDLSRFATVNHGAANIVVRTGEVGSAAVRALTDRIEAILADRAFPESVLTAVTGHAVLLNRAADGVARSQPRTVATAALVIFVLLSVGLRSVRFGAVAMLPNVVPVLIFFGVLGLGAAPLSLPTSLIGSVALGIAIDATAHYLVRYRAERLAGADPEQAVARTGLQVGRPVAIAALMLTLGFLSVSASEFATLRQFGLLTAFTMATCAATDLLLLPAILVRWKF
ncbi:MAG: MMPL family transporter [Myxococcota bacterium]|jgi:predicted RND superfamily exporter protein|nr:MMPL family transporter [bacterium]MDP6074280.1 MMPL family transporter [Myxococcota bacterium]MDP7074614.1 MMPL family transporter [Myxococcota bacterium]MDP7299414.1 MMPL family transporter [Myxococcota bacterium]MDP7432064.1 MMPL family transporter [Myxococcota bacterium]